MQTNVIRSTQEFFVLKQEWDQLLAENQSDNIFLTHEWLYTWWEEFQAELQLFIVTVRDERQRLIGLAPLMIKRRLCFRFLTFLASPLSDYQDFIVSGNEQARAQILEKIFYTLKQSTEWDLFRLKQIPHRSPNRFCLEAFCQRKDDGFFRAVMATHKERAPFLTNPGKAEKYFSGLKTKFLSDTRRRRKKLNAHNELIFQLAVCDDKEIDCLLYRLREFHKARRQAKGGISFFHDNHNFIFLRNIARIFRDHGWLHLSALRCGEKIVAIHLGFIYQGRFGYQFPVFDESYKPFAVSRLLLVELIREAFDRKVSTFDFLLGEEGYKDDWRPDKELLWFCMATPKTLRGRLIFLLFYDINIALKKFRRKSW